MEEDGRPEMTRSRRKNDVSRGAAGAHEEGDYSVWQGCRTEFQHRDISVRESNREAPASRLRARGFKSHPYRQPVL